MENFKLPAAHGADPCESNTGRFDHNYDPLTYALHNDTFLLNLLDNFDYDLKKVFAGQNDLHLAYQRRDRLGPKAFLRLWRKSGLDINSLDPHGRSVLDKAVLRAGMEYVRFFLSLGMSEKAVKQALQTGEKTLRSREQAYRRTKREHDRETVEQIRTINKILTETTPLAGK